VPTLVLYAHVFISRLGSETRYLTDNGDLTILSDSVDSPWTAVKSLWISTLTKKLPLIMIGISKVITSEFQTLCTVTRIASRLSHAACFTCHTPALHPRPPEPSPFSCCHHQCRIPL